MQHLEEKPDIKREKETFPLHVHVLPSISTYRPPRMYSVLLTWLLRAATNGTCSTEKLGRDDQLLDMPPLPPLPLPLTLPN